MKRDGRLDRNPLKGALGDVLHVVLCGGGHIIRLLMSRLRSLARNYELDEGRIGQKYGWSINAPCLIWGCLASIQYAGNEFRRLLMTNGILGGMSRKGYCWDNSVVDSFFRK